MKFGQRV